MPRSKRFITTSAMEISDAWRAAALPLGALLMIVVSLLRLARAPGSRWALLGAVAIVIGLGLLLLRLGRSFGGTVQRLGVWGRERYDGLFVFLTEGSCMGWILRLVETGPDIDGIAGRHERLTDPMVSPRSPIWG